MFRIPYGKKSNFTDNRPPVIIVHGILCSSTDWVITGANNSLGNIFISYSTINKYIINTNLKKEIILKKFESFII